MRYVLRSDIEVATICFDNKTADEVLKLMKAYDPLSNWTECQEMPSDSHICKFCGTIVQGADEDKLCSECRETFGHSFFSEL